MRSGALACVCLAVRFCLGGSGQSPAAQLLVQKCLKCHGDRKPKGGLKLTARAHLLRGGDSGPAVVAGKPDQSLLVRAVRGS